MEGFTTTQLGRLLPLLLLLILAFSFSTNSVSAGDTTSASPADFIRASCGCTRYPALCVQSLSAYGPKVHRSPRELANAALTVSSDRARSAATFVAHLASPGPTPRGTGLRSREAGAVRDCIETMSDSVDRLRRSVEEMGRMGRATSPAYSWHLSNVQTWVSAALTDETTCLDGLPRGDGASGVRAAIRKRVVDVAQVTSNALALVNRIGSRN